MNALSLNIVSIMIFTLALSHAQNNDFYSKIRNARESYENGDFNNALEQYDEAFKQGVDYDSIPEKFQANYKSENYEKAIKVLLERTSESSNHIDDAYNLGNAYFKSSDINNAIEHYKTVLRKNPNDTEARHNLSMALRKKNNNSNDQNNKDEDQKKNKQNEDELIKNKNQKMIDNLSKKELETKAKLNKGSGNNLYSKDW